MANPDQEKILLKPTYEVVKSICSKFQDESGSTDFYEEIKSQKYR